MRINTKSTLLAAAITFSLTSATAFAQNVKANTQAGASAAPPVVQTTPAVPVVPATPAVPTVPAADDLVNTVPAVPATPAVPAVKVDGDTTVKTNGSLDPTAVARDHQSSHAVDGQVVSEEAKAEADLKQQEAKAEAKPVKKTAKKTKKPL